MIKKVFSLIMVGVFVLSLFGCSSTSSNKNESIDIQIAKAKCVTEYMAGVFKDNKSLNSISWDEHDKSYKEFFENIDSVTFGNCYADYEFEKMKPMEWFVLEKNGNEALLISKYILHSGMAIRSKFGNYFYRDLSVHYNKEFTWEEDWIRDFLNNEFYNSAFNQAEKEKILVSNVPITYNKFWNTHTQNSTNDKVYILSAEEYEKYFEKNKSTSLTIIRKNNLSEHNPLGANFHHDFFDDGRTSEVYLRTPGEIYTTRCVACGEGGVAYGGQDDSFPETGIRPVIKIKTQYVEKWDNGYYYINDVKQSNTWANNGSNRYYLGSNGLPVKNKWINNHYLGEDGIMYRNKKTPDGKYVNYNGEVVDIDEDVKNIEYKYVDGDTWYRSSSDIWYYFLSDRVTRKKGWHHDEKDNQDYYLDPDTGVMLTGWIEIDGDMYYFNEEHEAIPNWYYVEGSDTWESYGNNVKSFGSMYRNETTPDGKRVDSNGRMIK